MNSWCAPRHVGGRHSSNQLSEFGGDLRTARSIALGELPPVPPESTPMPAHDSSRLYDHERRSPFFPDLHKQYPEQTISIMELRPRPFPFQNRQLLPQRGILQCDLFVAEEDEHEKSECPENRLKHDATLCLQRRRKSISLHPLQVFGEGSASSTVDRRHRCNSGSRRSASSVRTARCLTELRPFSSEAHRPRLHVQG